VKRFLWLVAACGKSASPELAVPDVEQATDYTCSASALQAVLGYYNVDLPEQLLATELGATPADGAPPDAILRVARAHGLAAEVRDGTTRADLAAELADRHPVIVDLQAWADAPPKSWADDWADGHYVVLVAIEGTSYVFEDPSLAGKRAVLPGDELDQRWHDEDGGRRHDHTAILFHTPPPATPRVVHISARAHMD
jgi:predicted double-glycine peptidase